MVCCGMLLWLLLLSIFPCFHMAFPFFPLLASIWNCRIVGVVRACLTKQGSQQWHHPSSKVCFLKKRHHTCGDARPSRLSCDVPFHCIPCFLVAGLTCWRERCSSAVCIDGHVWKEAWVMVEGQLRIKKSKSPAAPKREREREEREIERERVSEWVRVSESEWVRGGREGGERGD